MAKSFKKSIQENTELKEKKDLKSLITSGIQPQEETDPSGETRISFMLDNNLLERLKDYVWYNRTSQKEAINDALNLFFEQAGKFGKRPDDVIRKEKEKNKNRGKKR